MPRLKLAAIVLLAFAVCLTEGSRHAGAQTAQSLATVHKLFVPPLKGEVGTLPLHDELVRHLQSDGKYEIVASPGQADAVLTGASQIWITSRVSVNPRNASSNARPNYAGYLSVEMTGKDNEPLWSYLVVPSRFLLGSITSNLAKNAVRALVSARTESTPPAAAPSSAVSTTRIVLHGAGASFPAPLYGSWIVSFHKLHPEIDIDYEAVGSEAGTQQLAAGKIDFAASELPPTSGSSSYRRIPSVLGGVVPIYNLQSVKQYLRFTPDVLAGIYLGRITRWNDPAIRASNRGISLPDAAILVVHRSDGSGTTYTWSSFLSQSSDDWKKVAGAGATLRWPTGEGAPLNEGVASRVAATPNSIGYVELVYAIQHQLSYGAVRNRAGVFVHADLDSLRVAAQGSRPGAEGSITNASEKDAYPLAAFTWILVPQDAADSEKQKALRAFLEWALTSGQRSCAALAYAPLPDDIAAREMELLRQSHESH